MFVPLQNGSVVVAQLMRKQIVTGFQQTAIIEIYIEEIMQVLGPRGYARRMGWHVDATCGCRAMQRGVTSLRDSRTIRADTPMQAYDTTESSKC